MKLLLVTLLVTLSGCSLVQWLPSRSCEYVKYERIKNDVQVQAECKV
jgi:uncharacterized protein YceK